MIRGNFEEMGVSVSQNNNEKEDLARQIHLFSRAHWRGEDVITPENVARGLNFQEQWDYALKKDPPFIFVTGWNEWGAARLKEFLGVKQPVVFADNFDAAHSRDAEPVKGHFGDAYYAVRREHTPLQGVRAIDPVKCQPIRVDGDFSDWAGYAVFRDTPQIRSCALRLCGRRPDVKFRTQRHVEAKVSADAEGVCFYVRTAAKLIEGDPKNWMRLFVDTDADASTGKWLGYELEIQPGRPSPDVQVSIGQSEIELRIPFLLFPNGKTPEQLDFKWVDNCLEKKDWSDFTLHGDAAPNDRYNYRAMLLKKGKRN